MIKFLKTHTKLLGYIYIITSITLLIGEALAFKQNLFDSYIYYVISILLSPILLIYILYGLKLLKSTNMFIDNKNKKEDGSSILDLLNNSKFLLSNFIVLPSMYFFINSPSDSTYGSEGYFIILLIILALPFSLFYFVTTIYIFLLAPVKNKDSNFNRNLTFSKYLHFFIFLLIIGFLISYTIFN